MFHGILHQGLDRKDGPQEALRMLPGTPLPPPSNLQWMESGDGTSASRTGIWEPLVSAGQPIRKGRPISIIRNYTGVVLERLAAVQDGVVLAVVVTPPVNAGETLLSVRIPTESRWRRVPARSSPSRCRWSVIDGRFH